MNKKLLSMALFSVLSLSSVGAEAFYVGMGLGSSSVDPRNLGGGPNARKHEGKFSYTVSAGMELPVPLIPIRAEVEYLNFKSSIQADAKTRINGFAANVYVGLPLIPVVKPYVGFGLGSIKQVFNLGPSDTDYYKSDNGLTPQYMIGLDLDLPIIPVAGGVEYRYVDKKFDFPRIGKMRSTVSTVLAKVRFKF